MSPVLKWRTPLDSSRTTPQQSVVTPLHLEIDYEMNQHDARANRIQSCVELEAADLLESAKSVGVGLVIAECWGKEGGVLYPVIVMEETFLNAASEGFEAASPPDAMK